MPDIDDLFEFYRDWCIPAYSDLVGYVAVKPEQIPVEFENAFAHVAQFYNPGITLEEKVNNISKAKDHLIRVTLDSYKLLWTEMEADIDLIKSDPFKLKYCINMKQGDFLSKYQNFKQKAQTARNLEMGSIGIDPLSALDCYKEAIDIGRELIDAIDREKVKYSESDVKIISTKKFLFALFIAVLSGTIINWGGGLTNWIYNHFF